MNIFSKLLHFTIVLDHYVVIKKTALGFLFRLAATTINMNILTLGGHGTKPIGITSGK